MSRLNYRLPVCLLAVAIHCLAVTRLADAAGFPPIQMSFNAYPYLQDVKSDADITVNTFIPLPAGFSYFSFVNFGDVLSSGSANFLLTEQNLIWNVKKDVPLDLVAQDTIRRGHDNDTVHIGVRWRLNNTAALKTFFDRLHLNYAVQFFPLRMDQREAGGWQISHTYQMTFPWLSDRLYLSGFLDHNISESLRPGENRDFVICETQLGFRLYERLHAVVEYRINEYRRTNTDNIAAGLEVKATW